MPLTPKRLQRLVTHREHLEKLQERRLAEVHRAHRTREEALAAARQSRETYLALGAPAAGTLDITTLGAGAAFGLRMEREIEARLAALRHSGNAVEFERQQLLSRRRDRKAMETLLERRVEAERLGERRHEVKRMDEAAGQRWVGSGDPNTDSRNGDH
jgi:flagellar export protein FliJ